MASTSKPTVQSQRSSRTGLPAQTEEQWVPPIKPPTHEPNTTMSELIEITREGLASLESEIAKLNKELDTLSAKCAEMREKPCYCLGKNTILQVATEGQLQTDLVDFVAADDLFHQDPYVQIFQLTKERDQLAAKCGTFTDLIRSAYSLIIEHHSSIQMREELIECPCCTSRRGDEILNRLHAAYTNPTQCGEGWLSPEKKKVLVEALHNVLCRVREWEPGLVDFPDDTDLGQAVAKAKQALEACK